MTESRVKFREVGATTLQAELQIRTSPEKVYIAWTQQDHFVKWFGPRDRGLLEVNHFDCSVGGGYHVTMTFSDGERVQLVGGFEELDPPHKIVFTWQWKEGPSSASGPTLVTVDLKPNDLGTLLTLTHERFPTEESRNRHQYGWGPVLDRLAQIYEPI